MSKKILITGGAGFIGSHVVNHFVEKYPDYQIIVLDALTYASNIENINGVEIVTLEKYNTEEWSDKFFPSNLVVEVGDITSHNVIDEIFYEYGITDIIHLAAESHVDNSIDNPMVFVNTNVIGTVNLLNVAKKYWGENSKVNRFYHVSTDEVYGDLELDSAPFTENTPYDPSSPYSASKAASDHFVRAYGRTYGMDYVISNCSNNYGPHQHDEKLIPTVIRKLVAGEKIPVYGTGENIRDWLWVGDHVNAIDEIFHNGRNNQTYNIGGDNELTNLELINIITEIYKEQFGHTASCGAFNCEPPFKFVSDRKGHDFRYSVNSNYLQTNLNWKPSKNMGEGILETIQYYVK